MDSKHIRLNLYNFKKRKFKNQPFIIELEIYLRQFKIYFYPAFIEFYNKHYEKELYIHGINIGFCYEDCTRFKESRIEINNKWINLIDEVDYF